MTHFVLQITVNLFENFTLNDALWLTTVIGNFLITTRFETNHFELQISMKSFENRARVTYLKHNLKNLYIAYN